MQILLFIVSKNYFEFQYVIGRGGFGKVWQVIMKKNNKQYALKEMSKVKIIDRRSEKSIKGERDLLSKLHNPFIVNMICAFQDYETLYLVMDLLTGGDLRYHLCRIQKFSEEETKFFIACVLLGLEYIHGNNIIHRDIKPENLVCDDKGYIRITDFGVAKIKKEDNSSETSGTPGYMAPEVLLAQNHSFPVDFFAIGVMGYEFMLGERPYIGRSRKEIKHLVLRKEARIDDDVIPNGWSYESVDFINKCLRRKHSKRLGYNNGVTELKDHEWFFKYNWEKLYNKKVRAPFIPKKGGNYDKKYCEAIEKITETTFDRYQSYINQKSFGEIFEGYTFINFDIIQNSLGIETLTRMTTNTKQSKLQSSGNLTNNNEKKKLNIYNNINILKNKNENNYSSSPREKDYNKYSNNILLNKEIIKDKIEEKEEKEKLKLKKEESIFINNNNLISTPKNQNKKKFKLDKKNIHIQLNDDGDGNKKYNDNNIVSSNSINNNINIMKNNMKKINSSNEKESQKLRNTSVDISNNNFKNNLSSYNMKYINQKNSELNSNNNISNRNKKDIDKNNYINESLSNPNREKFYKLKNYNGLKESFMNKRNLNEKREISGLFNSNNYKYKKHNNYIQLRQNSPNNKNKNSFYLPNLNKNSSMLNIYGFKKKTKLNLNQLKLNINYNFKNDFLNNNNKFFISPTNKKLRKNGSTILLNSIVNSNNNNKINYNLNNNKNNNNFNLFSPISLKRNYSNFSHVDIIGNSNRNSNSIRRK